MLLVCKVYLAKEAQLYGMPRTTLSDHVHGTILPGATTGAPTLLSISEEQDLVEFLLRSAAIGYAKTKQEVLDIVSRIAAFKEALLVDGGINLCAATKSYV